MYGMVLLIMYRYPLICLNLIFTALIITVKSMDQSLKLIRERGKSILKPKETKFFVWGGVKESI
jgi:hypothetical protein